MSSADGHQTHAGLLEAPPAAAHAPALADPRDVRGLDSIRFWCALWVYFSHFGFIPLPDDGSLPHVVIGLSHHVFCGVAGVIVFFLVSGFCIHIPFVRESSLALGPFYARRFLRILPPLGVVLIAVRLCGADMVTFYEAIIWSLIAESIYYAIYPLLRPLLVARPKLLFTLAYVPALCLIARDPLALNFHQSGPATTWLLGLPSWLLGCQLATWSVEDRSHRPSAPWIWRGVVWGSSSLASVLRFHANIGYPVSLTLFSVLAFVWLREEIRYFRSVTPPAWSESCGRFSYSIYLLHGLVALGTVQLIGGLPSVLGWFVRTGLVLLGSYVFYLLVEKPSHQLARRAAQRWRSAPSATSRAA